MPPFKLQILASIEILEPEIVDIVQTADPTSGDADDTIALEINLSNSGSTTAFEVQVTDNLATDKFDNLSNIVVIRNGDTD